MVPAYQPAMSTSLSHADDRPAIDLLRATLATEEERARFDRLLALLESPTQHGRTARIESTVAMVGAARDADRAARVGHASPLAPAEGELVDRWVEGGSDDRIERLVSLLALPADDRRTARIDSTLERLQREVDSQTERLRLDPSREIAPSRRRLRLSDLGAIAAALVIVASIGFPAMSNFQTNTWAARSTSNLQQAGFASALFAADHDAKIPHTQRTTDQTTHQWWHVGDAKQSHSAHLFSLITGGYVDFEVLNAPGNASAPHSNAELGEGDWRSSDQLSYSYRLFDEAPRLPGLQRTVLLADRSPVVRQAVESGTIDPQANSDNHRGKGQHLAFGDASVVFVTSPTLPDGDNLWLPRNAERSGVLSLRGDERPADATDQFVGP
ncbi:MAG: hypothetical protein Tsb0013_16530 [Phycisphaerales bacterium]